MGLVPRVLDMTGALGGAFRGSFADFAILSCSLYFEGVGEDRPGIDLFVRSQRYHGEGGTLRNGQGKVTGLGPGTFWGGERSIGQWQNAIGGRNMYCDGCGR